jgi:type III pantothenate kinase
MLLAVDVGNTNVVFGVHDGERWLHHWRVRTVRDKMPDEYGALLRMLLREADMTMGAFDHIAMASVVPPLSGRMEEMFAEQTRLTPLVVSHEVDTGLTFAVDNPAEVGADLIADAVAVLALTSGPCVVVDFGTATTFTAVSGDATFMGVAIAPGVNLSAAALSGGTAQLPQVRLQAPRSALGTNTIHSIQSGVMLGYVSMVEGMLGRFEREIGDRLGEDDVTMIATGGLANVIAPLTDALSWVEPWLTLDGIRMVAERNR